MNKVLSTLIIILLSGILVWALFFRKVPTPDPIVSISYQYKTDTVWKDTLYVPGKPYPVPTPPKYITKYISDTALINALRIQLSESQVIITGLKDSIAISKNYLKQYPRNPKLIAFNIKKDTMALGLLQITGQVEEREWPVDFTAWNYNWSYPTGLSREKVPEPPTLKEPFANYFVGGGVDLLYKSPYISGKIEKDWASIRLYGTIDVGLLKSESSSIKLGVDYKIQWRDR